MKYKVHCGYTTNGRNKWKRFETLESATVFCNKVFLACKTVLTIEADNS